MKNEWISSDQGLELYAQVGLSENTFFRNAREGKIRKSLPEDRERGALYNLEDINKVVDFYKIKRRKRAEAIRTINEETSKTDWVKASDLPYLLTLDYEMYGIEEAVDLSITHAWWEKNPYMCRVLYNTKDRKDVWGYATVMPMEEETVYRLLQREMHERDIRPADILTYEEGKEYNCYATSIVIKPEHRAHIRDLIKSMLNYWCEQYPKIKISKVYAYADSTEGWNMIKQLFFAPRYDIGKRAFELDLYQENPSKLVQSFQNCLSEKEAEV